MESLARLVVAGTDLLEAEGRVLKRQAARFGLAAGIGIVAMSLVLTGLGFLLFGLFNLLQQFIPTWSVALLFALVAIGMALGALMYAKRLVTR